MGSTIMVESTNVLQRAKNEGELVAAFVSSPTGLRTQVLPSNVTASFFRRNEEIERAFEPNHNRGS